MNTEYRNLKVANIKAGQWFKMSYVTTVTLSAAGRRACVLVLKRVVGTFRLGIS